MIFFGAQLIIIFSTVFLMQSENIISIGHYFWNLKFIIEILLILEVIHGLIS